MNVPAPQAAWANPPLTYVLMELRFPPLRNLAAKIDSVSEALAESYPVADETRTQSIELRPDGSLVPHGEGIRIWRFKDLRVRWMVTLSEQNLTLQTTQYTNAEEFFNAFHSLLEAVQPALTLRTYVRIGVRYQDVVEPKSGERLADYLAGGLCGYPFDQLDAEPRTQVLEAQAASAIGRMLIRCIHNKEGLVVHPDITGGLKPRREVQKGEWTALLDFDHIWECPDPNANGYPPFSAAEIVRLASELQEVSAQAFKAAATEHAISVWRDG